MKSTGVHATLLCLPLPHRYAETVLSESSLQRRRINYMGESRKDWCDLAQSRVTTG
jgi:hypothetical protein